MVAGRDKKKNAFKLLGGDDTIGIGRDMLCPPAPYAGFFLGEIVRLFILDIFILTNIFG